MKKAEYSDLSNDRSKRFAALAHIAFAMLIGVFFIELVRTAWISDDAGITLRTVINFLNGYGPRFNVDERVQGYTHPLWFILLSAVSYLAGNVYYTTFFVSIVVSLLAFWIVIVKIPTKVSGGVITGLILILSKSYVDFSSSGLENPLSHLLLAIMFFIAIGLFFNYRPKILLIFCVTGGLLYLNRADLLVLIAPLGAYILVGGFTPTITELPQPSRAGGALLSRALDGVAHTRASAACKALMLGALPVLLWTIFSTYYYGFPFPNTAYAKLATGISLAERVEQGYSYFSHFAQTDPLSCFIILIGVALGLERRNYLAASVSIGIVLYLGFVLSIGGDFMTGRFFTAPLLMATMQIARLPLSPSKALMVICVVIGLGSLNINQTLLSGSAYSNAAITSTGIGDERGFYYQEQGLLTAKSGGIFTMRDWSMGAKEVEVTCGGLGFKSLYAGPSTHFIDTCALTDPLLARTPSLSSRQRIGHFIRALPAGYTESVAQQKNLIEDGPTRSFYDSIILITRGNLNDVDRLKNIVAMNLGLFKRNSGAAAAPLNYRYPISLNETIYFKKDSKGSFFLRDGSSQELFTNGWPRPEDWGVWAVGSIARLSLPIPILESPKALNLDAQILVPPGAKYQTVEVYKVVGGLLHTDFFGFTKELMS